jgi:hypothetical protein
MNMLERQAQLENLTTGEWVTAPFDELQLVTSEVSDQLSYVGAACLRPKRV